MSFEKCMHLPPPGLFRHSHYVAGQSSDVSFDFDNDSVSASGQLSTSITIPSNPAMSPVSAQSDGLKRMSLTCCLGLKGACPFLWHILYIGMGFHLTNDTVTNDILK